MYFHAMVDIFTRADADPSDYSTAFGLSILPYYSIHLYLQRAHDEKIAPTCAATVMPPALRPNIHEDILAQYELMSQDPQYSHLNFPSLDFGREVPHNLAHVVHNFLREEHRAFIEHL